MRFTILFVLLFAANILTAQEQNFEMKMIFNGKDLEGWLKPENNIWWTVEDGILWVKSDPEKRESILWTNDFYEDFVFQTDFKMAEGTVDSGIFLREEDVQIQIGISGSLKRDLTGSPYIPGKGYPVEADNTMLDKSGWNTMRIEARGQHLRVWLNDQRVLDYTVEKAAQRGPLGLQLHGGNTMSIGFRNIKVAAL